MQLLRFLFLLSNEYLKAKHSLIFHTNVQICTTKREQFLIVISSVLIIFNGKFCVAWNGFLSWNRKKIPSVFFFFFKLSWLWIYTCIVHFQVNCDYRNRIDDGDLILQIQMGRYRIDSLFQREIQSDEKKRLAGFEVTILKKERHYNSFNLKTEKKNHKTLTFHRKPIAITFG